MFSNLVKKLFVAEPVSAHCDGPCGVYDPAQARVHGEAVLAMTQKLLALDPADTSLHNVNMISRYIAIKEEEAHATKLDVLVLWTDFFKPVHLETYPELHDLVWKTTQLCSATKVHVDLEKAEALMENLEKIHNIFWAIKGKQVPFGN